MKYFAYGSNMSLQRIRKRVPSAQQLGLFTLKNHELRFHKKSKDGSGKCDAFQTDAAKDIVMGALFEMNLNDKPTLDKAEELGIGYGEKVVTVSNSQGESHQATMYYALKIEPNLKPYFWYLNHVITGAKQIEVSQDYLNKLNQIECIKDAHTKRKLKEESIYLN